MTDKELMQQAMEDICAAKLCEMNSMSSRHEMIRLMDKAIAALRERLAREEQEPKCGAIIEVFGKDWRLDYMSLPVGKHKLYTQQYNYTAPAQRKPLTDEEIGDLKGGYQSGRIGSFVELIRAIEAKLKEKNT